MGEINTDMKEFWEIAVSIATVLPVIGVALFSIFRNKMNTPFDNLLMDDTDKSISSVIKIVLDITLIVIGIDIYNVVSVGIVSLIRVQENSIIYEGMKKIFNRTLTLTALLMVITLYMHLLIKRIAKLKHNRLIYGTFEIMKAIIFLICIVVVFPYIVKRLALNELFLDYVKIDYPDKVSELILYSLKQLMGFTLILTQKWRELLFIGTIECILMQGFNSEGIGGYLSRISTQCSPMKLVDIRAAKLYYAYKVRDNQLLYGEKEVLKEQSVIRSIPMDSIYNGSKYFLINPNVKRNVILKKEDVNELIKNSGTDYILIDVSEERAFEREHINGAISIPELSEETKEDSNRNNVGIIIGIDYYKNMLIEKTGRNIELDCRIMIYCKNEIRAEMAAVRCMIAGYTNVYQTSGAAHWEWEQNDGFYHVDFADQIIDDDDEE
ncbi:rhodanese-like domain-containing protein [Stomatobaculum longum]|uniref:rhodanese-like domain-containing protein n=1 Tax=Stomatobaculum longum TaxID=796942 RepID=UPI0028EF710F|nr:rhodanese-like domain-containing protein [Stomatobaculum longum]